MSQTIPVEILAYQQDWPTHYETIKSHIQSTLGELILAIEHIGSTAIPEMPAKNIIDIQLGVNDFLQMNLISNKLKPLGFVQIETIKQDHIPFQPHNYFEAGYEKRFFQGKINNIACNLHIREYLAENWNFAIQFRDFLIKNTEAAKAYAQIKTRLAETHTNLRDYCYIKDPVCDLIYLLFKHS